VGEKSFFVQIFLENSGGDDHYLVISAAINRLDARAIVV
jgi:hypothetical protein